MDDMSTVKLSRDTKARLRAYGANVDTFNDVVMLLLDFADHHVKSEEEALYYAGGRP